MDTTLILNAALNAKNTIDKENIKNLTTETIKQLVHHLLSISGPYSRNTFVVRDTYTLTSGLPGTTVGGHSADKVFTRDGRKTLERIEYASPIQRYLKDEILIWIGERIDAMCHDGTTSSMIFTASFLMELLKNRDALTFMSTTDIEKVYQEVIDELLHRLEDSKITVAKLQEYLNDYFKKEEKTFSEMEIREFIAYMQAYTSSSANEEVSRAVSKVIAHTPKNDVGTNIIQKVPVNSETKTTGIFAKQEDWEYSVEVSVLTQQENNAERGMYFKSDHADVLVLRTGLYRDTMVGIGLMNYLNNYPEDAKDRHLILLIPHAAQNLDMNFLEDILYNVAPSKGIKIFCAAYIRPIGYTANGPERYYMDALNAKANVPIVQEMVIGNMPYQTVEPFIIHDVSAYCDHHQIYFNNVIDWEKIDSRAEVAALKELNTHPGEKYPELYKEYTDSKNWFNAMLDDLCSKIGQQHYPTIVDLKDALVNMATYKNWYVDIQGKKHDIEMYQAILEDSTGAAVVSLDNGLYFNGSVKLFATIVGLLSSEKFKTPAHTTIILALMSAARDMVYAMFGNYSVRIGNNVDDIVGKAINVFDYFNVYQDAKLTPQFDLQAFSYLHPDTKKDLRFSLASQEVEQTEPMIITFARSYFMPETIKNDGFNSDSSKNLVVAPPCQTGNLFEVLFNRLREVALRFIFTDSIIAPGTIWDDGSLKHKASEGNQNVKQ